MPGAYEDQASLEAQLASLQSEQGAPSAPPPDEKTKPGPRRAHLPDHLRRVDYHHEPADTTCPTAGCGQAMARIGEDITEKLDVVPAEFFVHRHIRGKWACRCCQVLVQQPVAPQIIDKGMLDARVVVRTRWRRTAAALRCTPRVHSGLQCAACRRDARQAARPRSGQDEAGLCLGLCEEQV